MKSIDPLLAFSECRSERTSLVTTVDSDNTVNIMSVALNMKASLNPPMMVISVHNSRRSCRMISESKEFVVAMANESLIDDVKYAGTTSGFTTDKMVDLQLKTRSANKVRPPLVEDATFNFECKVLEEVQAADHILFVAEVVAAHQSESEDELLLYMPDNDEQIVLRKG